MVADSTEADHSGNDRDMESIESTAEKQEPVSDSVQLATMSVRRDRLYNVLMFVSLHGNVCCSAFFHFYFIKLTFVLLHSCK